MVPGADLLQPNTLMSPILRPRNSLRARPFRLPPTSTLPFRPLPMRSYWFLPYAIACGNSFILKPSERVPLSMHRAFELLEKTGLPKGVVNLVNGGKEVVNALCDHPQVRAISFVGSTPVAKHVYSRSAASGKRMQCQGGAKNHVIVLPDADMELATQIISDSAFGCDGQRCLP